MYHVRGYFDFSDSSDENNTIYNENDANSRAVNEKKKVKRGK